MSGKNSKRTSQTVNGVAISYCYDYADRLKSSSDPLANNAQYDSHGNMTQLGSGSSLLRLYYDSSNKSHGFEQYDGSGKGKAAYYSRDVQGRVTSAKTTPLPTGTGTSTTSVGTSSFNLIKEFNT